MSRKLSLAASLTILLSAGCTSPNSEAEPATEELAVTQVPQEIDWSAVEAALGRSGALQDGGVYRVGMPRSDLSVTSQGVAVRPTLALGSWVAFAPSGSDEAVMMGDLVLTEEELNPVISRLQEGGVGQTAIHKHLLEEEPAIWWTHVHAHGDPVEIAETVGAALELTGTPTDGAVPEEPIALDTAGIREILGRPGGAAGGVYNTGAPRAETIRASGVELPPPMGTGTGMNFQPTGEGRAAINGVLVLMADEVNEVIQALREHDIGLVSLHSHMLDEEPRLFFAHFWAEDDALDLARGLRAALDRMNVRPPEGG